MGRTLAGNNWTIFPDEQDSDDNASNSPNIRDGKRRITQKQPKAELNAKVEPSSVRPAKRKRPPSDAPDKAEAVSSKTEHDFEPGELEYGCPHSSSRCTEQDPCRKCIARCKKRQATGPSDQKKYVLIWEKKELLDMLVDFGYFFALRVFDGQCADRFKRENPNHRHFKAYTRISDANACILKSVPISFQFKDDLIAAARRHSEILWLQREELHATDEKCEICGSQAWGVMCVRGKCYDAKTYEYLPKERQSVERKTFVLCKLHGKVASACFNLTHMNWTFYLNMRTRTTFILQQHPEYNAEQVIDAINPDVFGNLALHFLKFYEELDKLGTVNKSSSRRERDLAKHCLAWMRIVGRWKERAMRINRVAS